MSVPDVDSITPLAWQLNASFYPRRFRATAQQAIHQYGSTTNEVRRERLGGKGSNELWMVRFQ